MRGGMRQQFGAHPDIRTPVPCLASLAAAALCPLGVGWRHGDAGAGAPNWAPPVASAARTVAAAAAHAPTTRALAAPATVALAAAAATIPTGEGAASRACL